MESNVEDNKVSKVKKDKKAKPQVSWKVWVDSKLVHKEWVKGSTKGIVGLSSKKSEKLHKIFSKAVEEAQKLLG